jgi:hypothetical protein
VVAAPPRLGTPCARSRSLRWMSNSAGMERARDILTRPVARGVVWATVTRSDQTRKVTPERISFSSARRSRSQPPTLNSGSPKRRIPSDTAQYVPSRAKPWKLTHGWSERPTRMSSPGVPEKFVSGSAVRASGALSTFMAWASTKGAPRLAASAAAGPSAFHSWTAISDAALVAVTWATARAPVTPSPGW